MNIYALALDLCNIHSFAESNVTAFPVFALEKGKKERKTKRTQTQFFDFPAC